MALPLRPPPKSDRHQGDVHTRESGFAHTVIGRFNGVGQSPELMCGNTSDLSRSQGLSMSSRRPWRCHVISHLLVRQCASECRHCRSLCACCWPHSPSGDARAARGALRDHALACALARALVSLLCIAVTRRPTKLCRRCCTRSSLARRRCARVAGCDHGAGGVDHAEGRHLMLIQCRDPC